MKFITFLLHSTKAYHKGNEKEGGQLRGIKSAVVSPDSPPEVELMLELKKRNTCVG